MLYFIIRPLVRFTLRIFFSKIHLHHIERIPLDRPVLIASNHPSAFLEACVLATHFPKSLHFLVRGDIFINKFIVKLLVQLHLTPIYRSADGFKNLRANEGTFSACHRRLQHKEIIVVYAEGNTTQEKRLRPIQKGLAKIAFGALETYPQLDLCIVPLGINYTHPNDFRSEVYVEVGDLIEVKQFYSLDKTDTIKSINELTQAVEIAMKPLVLHIDRNEDLPLAEQLWSIEKAKANKTFWPVVDRSGSRFRADKIISEQVNAMEATEKKILNELLHQKMSAIPDSGLLLWTPVAWIGKMVNILPLWLGYLLTKSAVKRIEFFASVLVGATMFLYLIYMILLAIVGYQLGVHPLWSVTFVLATGLLYLYYLHRKERQNAAKLQAVEVPIPENS